MFSPLSILTVADDGSKPSYTNNENWSDKENVLLWKCKYSISFKISGPHLEVIRYTLLQPPPHVIRIWLLHPLDIWFAAFRIYWNWNKENDKFNEK